MSTRRSVRSSVLILESILLVLPAAAQIVSYEIPGTVKDPTGTAMVSAQVTSMGLETGGMRFFNIFNHPNFNVPNNTQGPTGTCGNGDAICLGRATACPRAMTSVDVESQLAMLAAFSTPSRAPVKFSSE